MISVAIISPENPSHRLTMFESHDFGYTFQKYIHQELSDIDAIYDTCKDTCDIIFFSGEFGYHYIKNRIPK